MTPHEVSHPPTRASKPEKVAAFRVSPSLLKLGADMPLPLRIHQMRLELSLPNPPPLRL